MGGVFCKKGTFPQRICIMSSTSIFLFYILLILRAYAPNEPPLPTGLGKTVER